MRWDAVPRSLRLWGHIAVGALFASAVPYLLFAVDEQSVNSSTAGVINATTPLWTVVLALAVGHQRTVTSWQAAGLIVGFGGGLLIFEPWGTEPGLTSAGALECLAASISYAVSYIDMDRSLAHRGLRPVTLSACQLLARVSHARHRAGRHWSTSPALHRRERCSDSSAGNYRHRHQRGRDRSFNGDLPIARRCHRARRPGPRRKHHNSSAGWRGLVLAGVALTRRNGARDAH
jgi:hypothetical protein